MAIGAVSVAKYWFLASSMMAPRRQTVSVTEYWLAASSMATSRQETVSVTEYWLVAFSMAMPEKAEVPELECPSFCWTEFWELVEVADLWIYWQKQPN